MTLAIKMRGELNEIHVPMSFGEFVADLNVAGATGKQYVIMRTSEDRAVALNTHNILTVLELDDDVTGLIG